MPRAGLRLAPGLSQADEGVSSERSLVRNDVSALLQVLSGGGEVPAPPSRPLQAPIAGNSPGAARRTGVRSRARNPSHAHDTCPLQALGDTSATLEELAVAALGDATRGKRVTDTPLKRLFIVPMYLPRPPCLRLSPSVEDSTR